MYLYNIHKIYTACHMVRKMANGPSVEFRKRLVTLENHLPIVPIYFSVEDNCTSAVSTAHP